MKGERVSLGYDTLAITNPTGYSLLVCVNVRCDYWLATLALHDVIAREIEHKQLVDWIKASPVFLFV